MKISIWVTYFSIFHLIFFCDSEARSSVHVCNYKNAKGNPATQQYATYWSYMTFVKNNEQFMYNLYCNYKETADFWCKNKKRNLRIYEGGILNNIHETKMYFKMSNILSIKTASCLQNGGGINELKRRLKLICFSRTTPFNYCYPPTHVSPLITNRPVNL